MHNIKKKYSICIHTYILISLLLFLFSVLKVFRGANTSSEQEGGIWNYISLFYYVLAIFGVIKNRYMRPRAVFIAPFLYCVFSMIFVIETTPMSLNLSTIYSYLMIPYFFLVFISFYFYSDPLKYGDSIILLAYVVCLSVNVYTILRYLLFNMNRAQASDIYFSLCMFPFVLVLTKNKMLKTVFIFVQLLTTFLANKRAGLIAVVVGLVVYFIIEANNKGRRSLFKVLKNIVLLAGILVVFWKISGYIDATYEFGIYNRLLRLGDDGGSGRAAMYGKLISKLQESSFFELLVGHGMKTAGKVVGAGYAHNDFLEIIYDFGILSFCSILVFYVALILQAVRMVIRRSPYAGAFAFSIVVGLVLSMFSYFLIYYTYVTCLVAFWGYILKMEKTSLGR